MFTYEDIEKVSKDFNTTPIKGKDYVQVNERVKAFRKICPTGSIVTRIIDLSDGVVTIMATVSDGDIVLATGIAQEKETSSFINKTSYIENCETSAVGRALGFCGIGIDSSIASIEEMVNAIQNQGEQKTAKEVREENEQKNANANKKITKAQHKQLIDLIDAKIPDIEAKRKYIEKLLNGFEKEKLEDLSNVQFDALMSKLRAA